ncbi:M81 family metallopeptidase [Cytobacillus depressus]|uniref:M81 family metallopeptidase n=1 Tax=Cytobacillus depressus TaxID=1602942 RepID=A0A6L3VAA4_9BACI|nr:M81 family metallopeptidase [Cytobacillus depressus]KAB2338598.1 M81 family metallopeptidase [Cytobacillus depressus]
MKIAIGQLSHETNTFSNITTTEDTFKKWEWEDETILIENHKGVKDYLGGMIDGASQLQIEVIPTFCAGALPSGIITNETYETIKSHFQRNLSRIQELDAVCLALHGAGVVEGIDDLEGDFLQFIREIVGSGIPIVATLDLHGNMTRKMVKTADLLLGVKLYPHTDSYEKGFEAINRAYQLVKKEIIPTMHLEQLPLMIPTSTSNLSPVKNINEFCNEKENQLGILDCTFFHGFPYTDVPFAGVSVLCITDDNRELAEITAKSVSSFVWEKREQFFPKRPTPEEGIERAQKLNMCPVVINETSDNPGAGTPCDGTRLLRAMLNAKLKKACIGLIYDPEVVELAHKQGVGTHIEAYLGGKTDQFHGEPVFIKGYIKTLTDGIYIQSSPMWKGKVVNLGRTVRIQVGGLDIIVGCLRNQVFDEQLFLLHGIAVSEVPIVGIKSSQHFRAVYESIAKKIITVDSPGLSTLNLNSFKYKKIQRPRYPIDDMMHQSYSEYFNYCTNKTS